MRCAKSYAMTITFMGLLFALAGTGSAQTLNTDPDSAQIVTDDIERFWQTYDRLRYDATEEDSLRAFFEGYYLPASPGLRDFIHHRMGSPYELVGQISKHPRYYASIRESTLRAASYDNEIRAAYRALASLYDAAVFPDTYIQIGVMNSGGTYTEDRILIGAEMFGRTAETPMDELGNWHRAVLKPVEEIPHIVAHELVHYQQRYPDSVRTLLSQSVREGAADFIAELISGRHINSHIHAWADHRESELWAEFREKMNGSDFTGWLYGGNQDVDRPADLGYWMGYKIVRAYHERAEDKRQAIRDILNIENFSTFLQASGYGEQFEE